MCSSEHPSSGTNRWMLGAAGCRTFLLRVYGSDICFSPGWSDIWTCQKLHFLGAGNGFAACCWHNHPWSSCPHHTHGWRKQTEDLHGINSSHSILCAVAHKEPLNSSPSSYSTTTPALLQGTLCRQEVRAGFAPMCSTVPCGSCKNSQMSLSNGCNC